MSDMPETNRASALLDARMAFDALEVPSGAPRRSRAALWWARRRDRVELQRRIAAWKTSFRRHKAASSRKLTDLHASRQRIEAGLRKIEATCRAREARLMRRIWLARLRIAIPYVLMGLALMAVFAALAYAVYRLPDIIEYLTPEPQQQPPLSAPGTATPAGRNP